MYVREGKSDAELLARLLVQVMGVRELVEKCRSEEDCAAIEQALSEIGVTVAALLGELPAFFDEFLFEFALSDEMHAAEVLRVLSDLSQAVHDCVSSRPAAVVPLAWLS